MDERVVKEYLLQNDESFRKLAVEHQEFERKLSEFSEKPFLTADEQIEETVIKKKKLALKDRMQFLIYQYQTQRAVH